MKAHDVRHLRLCAGCGSFGDRREMLLIPHGLVNAGHPVKQGLYHGGCAVTLVSHEDILALPHSETNKLRLSETGPVLMRKLLDARDPEFDETVRCAKFDDPQASACQRCQDHRHKCDLGSPLDSEHARAPGCRYPACRRAGECDRVCAAGIREHAEKLKNGEIPHD